MVWEIVSSVFIVIGVVVGIIIFFTWIFRIEQHSEDMNEKLSIIIAILKKIPKIDGKKETEEKKK